MDFHIIGGRKEDLVKIGLVDTGSLENLFFHGFVSPKEAALARKRCDVLLAPYQENVTLKSGKNTAKYMSPLKVFEYMEAGKAIIASDLPVLREVLIEDYNSLLCSPENLDQWVNKLNLLVSDEAIRCVLGENAQNDISQKYSWNKRAGNILMFVNNLSDT